MNETCQIVCKVPPMQKPGTIEELIMYILYKFFVILNVIYNYMLMFRFSLCITTIQLLVLYTQKYRVSIKSDAI